MHRPIKKYTYDGFIRDDSDFIRLRGEMERLVLQQMRTEGYLPIYELGSFWSTERVGNKYSFKLTMYASYVGKVKSNTFDYWQGGKLI